MSQPYESNIKNKNYFQQDLYDSYKQRQ